MPNATLLLVQSAWLVRWMLSSSVLNQSAANHAPAHLRKIHFISHQAFETVLLVSSQNPLNLTVWEELPKVQNSNTTHTTQFFVVQKFRAKVAIQKHVNVRIALSGDLLNRWLEAISETSMGWDSNFFISITYQGGYNFFKIAWSFSLCRQGQVSRGHKKF